MAFNIANFKQGREFGIYRNHEWYFDLITDDAAAMNTSGYFNGIAAYGAQIGDEIVATVWTTALPVGGHPAPTDVIVSRTRFVVVQISAAGVVDVSNGDALTLTDSD